MEYRVLGTLEVHDDGRSLPLAGAKQRALLALLLVHANRVLSRDRLIDELWGDHPPKTAVQSLQVYVSRLRKLLPPDTLLTRPPGYLLAVAPDELDLSCFERLHAQGHEALAAGDAERAAVALHQALALWRGPALAEFAFEPFAQAEIGRLEDLRLAALEERIEADLQLGRQADLIGELEALIAANPHRERLRGQLMLALYRSGRQAEALAGYREVRQVLVDQLGVDPSHELRRLEQAILAQDPALEAPAPTAGRRSNLPLQVEQLLGRRRELADLRLLVGRDGARLVTITGTGGVGKTSLAIRLAAELAGDYEHGAWLVDLSPLRESALVVPTIAQTLGARRELLDHLLDQQLLLVLDNFETVVEAAADISHLLQRTAGLIVVATSREPLHIRGEREYPLRPLAEASAVELFRQRAAAVVPDFDAPYEQVAEVCRRLEGLPLAIELAAARTTVLSPTTILMRLDERLPLLEGRRRDVPERQRTLRATIDWSYELLNDDERRLFRSFGVFVGGCTLEAAVEVCQADLETLESVVDKNVVRREGERYSMLETIREYARERLAEAGETDAVQRRHTEHFLARAEQLASVFVRREGAADAVVLATTASEPPLRESAPELANFRAALDCSIAHGLTDSALRFVTSLSWLWFRLDSHVEGLTWAERAFGLAGEVDLRVRARALEAAGTLATFANDLDRALELLNESLRLFRQIGDPFWIGVVLDGLADVELATGRPLRARARYEESLTLFSELSNERGIAAAQHGLALTYRELGEMQLARPLLLTAIQTFRKLGVASSVANALHSLGDLELEEGYLAEAETSYSESLAIAQAARMAQRHSAYCLGGLAATAASRGNAKRAGRLWGAVEAFEASRRLTLQSPERQRYELRIARVEGSTFEAAATVGRTLTLTDSVEHALSVD